MKYVFTGGSGLLGNELKKYFPDSLYPSRAELNVAIERSIAMFLYTKEFDVLVHMAAYTNTVKAEEDATDLIETNIIGTSLLTKYCKLKNKKLIYISTDYVFSGNEGNYKPNDDVNPVNKYGWSKLGGECAVRQVDENLIIRTSFCANEFPYDKAFKDQYTTRRPVSDMAKIIADIIKENPSGIRHACGKKQTVYYLAKEISPNKEIQPISINDMKNYKLPKDTSLCK
jgi:dTDP-4-dehydrorhamnose reductase